MAGGDDASAKAVWPAPSSSAPANVITHFKRRIVIPFQKVMTQEDPIVFGTG
jgi:hypothetical protein